MWRQKNEWPSSLFFCPTSPLNVLIFMTSHGWFFSHFVPLLQFCPTSTTSILIVDINIIFQHCNKWPWVPDPGWQPSWPPGLALLHQPAARRSDQIQDGAQQANRCPDGDQQRRGNDTAGVGRARRPATRGGRMRVAVS